MTLRIIMTGFFSTNRLDRWIEGDLTVEMRVTLRLPFSSKAINSGSPLFRVIVSLLRHPKPKPILSGALLSLHPEGLG